MNVMDVYNNFGVKSINSGHSRFARNSRSINTSNL